MLRGVRSPGPSLCSSSPDRLVLLPEGLLTSSWHSSPLTFGTPSTLCTGHFPLLPCLYPPALIFSRRWRQERGRSCTVCWVQLRQRRANCGHRIVRRARLPEVDGSGGPGLRFTLNPRKSPKLEKCSLRHRSLPAGSGAGLCSGLGTGARRTPLPSSEPCTLPPRPRDWENSSPPPHPCTCTPPSLSLAVVWVTRN